jgi:hypothetical protein
MTLLEYFMGQGLDIQRSLRQEMIQAKRNASGKTMESIQFEVLETRENIIFQVEADKTLRTLQEGRGPTKNDGPGAVKNSIRQWIKDKGIRSDIPEESLVYLITRKIHREGYKGTPGLIDDVINDSLIDFIEQEVAELVGNEFVNEIKV